MPDNKDRIAKLNKIIFGTEVQEDLDEAKKKKKKGFSLFDNKKELHANQHPMTLCSSNNY